MQAIIRYAAVGGLITFKGGGVMICYYNSGFSFRGVDPGYVPSQGEKVFPGYATDQQLNSVFPGYLAEKDRVSHNEGILSQIQTLELLQTPRRVREATTSDAGKAWLEALEAQIDALRGQLS